MRNEANVVTRKSCESSRTLYTSTAIALTMALVIEVLLWIFNGETMQSLAHMPMELAIVLLIPVAVLFLIHEAKKYKAYLRYMLAEGKVFLEKSEFKAAKAYR